MKGVLRKIVVGSDYKNGMAFIVGQSIINNTARIHSISFDTKQDEYQVNIYYNNKPDEIFCWKEFPRVIVSKENDLNAI